MAILVHLSFKRKIAIIINFLKNNNKNCIGMEDERFRIITTLIVTILLKSQVRIDIPKSNFYNKSK